MLKFWKGHIKGMGRLIDTEWKGCKSMGSGTLISPMALTLEFSRSNFEKAVFQEWGGGGGGGGGVLTWKQKRCESIGCCHHVGPTMWPSGMTLTLDFQGQILKKLYPRNEKTDLHATKGIWVDRKFDPLCHSKLWPHPWPWPRIFRVKLCKNFISVMGWLIDMEHKG